MGDPQSLPCTKLTQFISQKGALDLNVFHLLFLQPLRIFWSCRPLYRELSLI